jgi:hypothetical protein
MPRNVDALGHQIGVAVVKAQVQLHLRMPGHEVQRQRYDDATAEGHRGAYAQQPLGLALAQLHHVVGLLHFARDGFALLVVERARFGQAHAACVAVEQAYLQARLDRRDLFGHGRLRGGKFARRLGKASGLHHAHKHLHCQQSVHALHGSDLFHFGIAFMAGRHLPPRSANP